MAIQPERTGYIASGLGHSLLLAWGLLAFSTAPKPFEPDPGDSVPVEIVSDAPSQARRGLRTAENKPEPKRVVDRKAAEEKETDQEEAPIAKQAVQNVTPPPPPKPRVVEEKPRPVEEPKQVAAVPPVPTPTPRPKPAPSPTEAEKEETQREAELLAKKKEDEKKKQDEEKKKEDEKKRLEDEKKLAEEKKKAEEKKIADAKAKAEKERQDKANARTFDPNSIASRLTNPNAVSDRRQAARTEATGNQAPSRTASLGTATGNAAKLTASEIDALRAQIQQCWNVPAGAANAQDLVVRVQFSLNQDGTVNGRPEVLNKRGDPAFQAAANSAIRAIMQCGSNGRRYTLPPAKYETWREVAVNFDPRDMFR